MIVAILLALSPILIVLATELIFRLASKIGDWVKKPAVVMVADHPHNAYHKSSVSAFNKPLMQSISNRRYGYGKWGL